MNNNKKQEREICNLFPKFYVIRFEKKKIKRIGWVA